MVTRFLLNGKTLRFLAEGDVIVDLQQVERGLHILARLIELGHAPGEHREPFNVVVAAVVGNVGRRLS